MSRGQVAAWLVCLAILGLSRSTSASPPANAEPARSRLILKLRAEGAHAVTDGAEKLFRQGRGFASGTADGSSSLDEIGARIHIREIRSLFRRDDGRSFAEQRRRLTRRLQARVRGPAKVPDLSQVYRVEVGPGTSVEGAIALLAADPHVEWVQSDHLHRLDQVSDLPDDPFLHSSGSWGQPYPDLWGLYRIRAPEAWSISQGEGVVVAVVDTGLDYLHPDIADNVWVNPGEDLDGNGRVDPADWNGVDDDGNGFVDDLRGFDFANSVDADDDGRYDGPLDESDPDPFDDVGHGTHVAGTIAAVADNGIGVAGVAPRARIMALKGFPADGPGLDSVLWRAVLYAAENGARVINTSWSCSPECPHNPLAEEIVRLVHAMDVVLVTSAGNRRTDVVFNSPEKLRETITVASSGEDDQPSASFTNMGWLVDVAAPGGGPSGDPNVYIARRNILSLRSSADASAAYATVAEGYWRLSGTSMSAPHVSGVAALLRSAYPALDVEQVRRLIRQGATDTGPPGYDRRMGAGRLDAFASLQLVPLPDLDAAITGPEQGSVFDPRGGAVVGIQGTAAGADLASYSLYYGLGNEPTEWIPIATDRTAPVRDGVLAEWPLDGLSEGTYVVKLEVHGLEGHLYSELLMASLENDRRLRVVSEPGRPAAAPSVSGDLVVWQSRRSPEDPNEATEDDNLFASRLSDGSQYAISGAAGDQTFPSISGDVVSWLDTRAGLAGAQVYGCRLDPRSERCHASPVSDELVRMPPAAAAGRIFWLDDSSGEQDVRGCRPDRRGTSCRPFETGLPPGRRGFLGSSGRTLVWTEPGSRVGLCDVSHSGLCPVRAPLDPIPVNAQPAASGDLLAWVEARFNGREPLQICQLDPTSGDCPAVEVAHPVADTSPSLSGSRLVWDARIGDEASDVFFCEFDRIRQRCPVQRLTAQMARQAASAIDGRHVVWEDDRDGSTEIVGVTLPALAPLHDRRAVVGRLVVVPVRSADTGAEPPGRSRRGDPASEAPLRLGAEPVDADSLESLGATFFDSGRNLGLFFWRPRPDQVGSHAFTFSGTAETGLVTRQTIRIEVVPAREHRAGGRSVPGRAGR